MFGWLVFLAIVVTVTVVAAGNNPGDRGHGLLSLARRAGQLR